MGNKDKKVLRDFATCESYGVFLTKKVKKKVKMLHAGLFLKREKNNIRGFLNEFSKNAQISPIGKADYLLTSSFKVCLLEIFLMLNVGQHDNLRS